MQKQVLLVIAFALCFTNISYPANAQEAADDKIQELIDFHQFRQIGPFRGGRSAAVAGVPDKPMVAYMGAAGGGVWKTDDGGSNWRNISDGFFGGSIGAVEVSPSDPNTIYVGGGEVSVRGNVSHGNGVWKTIDGGKSWKHMGLEDSRRIPRIRIDPNNPDIVYAAVLGHLFGPNQERGVFKSTDGGETWTRTLFVDEEVGACDLTIDPNNPRILYASTWRILRTPYSLESGGAGCELWKSTDGGETWNDITRHPGLPKGTVGIIGVAVSPVDSNRVWVIIEADNGGLFRSDNGGESWTKINEERKLRQRAWYYSRIYADPENIDVVYCLNVQFWQSSDGGKTFRSIRTPHGDHHDLWINPSDTDHFVVADDGGAQVTFNRGQTFSTYMNQPTAQFYRVTTDNHFPYRIYGAQQDNSTVRITSRGNRGSIGERDWESTAGGESGHIAPHPENPDIVYGGSYGGFLTRFNHKTQERRNINVWPDNPMGHGAGDGKYRFQWNFPIFFSPHDSGTLYTAGNVLFKTTDEGASWTAISPDLTRNDPTKLGSSGGPITKDNTSVEYYCTIFAAAESHHEANTIWCGSDDGLLQITRDGGKNWENVTPPEMPEWAQINSIEVHPTEPGGLYVAATRYKLDDFKPYLYKTTDYGKTWKTITQGIDRKHFTRVVRADPDSEGLLFAGTESGLYVSFDDGDHWRSFQCNVPITPITDLAIKNGDLIVATQGRSFWVLDDLTTLHQWSDEVAETSLTVFQTRPTYRMGGGFGGSSLTTGTNVRGGISLKFFAKDSLAKDSKAKLTITDPNGVIAKTYSSKPEEGQESLKIKSGLNEIRWNTRYAGAKTFDGMVLWGGGTGGPNAIPGTFKATLTVESDGNQEVHEMEFELLQDPRTTATVEDLKAQFDFQIEIRDKLSETHSAIKNLRDLKTQLASFKKRIAKKEQFKELGDQAQKLIDEMSVIEKELYQTKNQSSQDPLNYPIKLNNRLSAIVGVVASGDNPPTSQAVAVRDEVVGLIDQQLEKLTEIFETGIVEFNTAVAEAKVPAIFMDEE